MELRKLVKEFKKVSMDLQKECEQYGIKFFDSSEQFNDVVEEAAEYLVND